MQLMVILSVIVVLCNLWYKFYLCYCTCCIVVLGTVVLEVMGFCVQCTCVLFIVVMGVLMCLLLMPDCWLEASVRKVLRPATSTQVFLVSLCLLSKC
jgi:hypothetical protein